MVKLYKNWYVYNLVVQPVMEILYLMRFDNLNCLGSNIHDATLPVNNQKI